MVAEEDETSKDKEIDKLMALISLSFKKIYKPTNNNLRTSSNTSRVNQDNSPRIIEVMGMKIKGLEEAGIQLNAEQADWRDDTNDDELEDQELGAHYMYIAQLQEVSPDAADSGPIFNDEPLQMVSNDDHYNVSAMESAHPEQSKPVHDTYPIEQDAQNVIIDSLDMNYDREEIDQNDDDNDLAKERELLASLIEKLKCEIDESKSHNKFLETSNKVLIEKLNGEIEVFKNKNKSLESSNKFFKEANNRLSETNNLMYADYKKSEAKLARRNSKEYASQMELECAKKEAQIKLYKTREDKELDKVIELENKVKVLDNIVYKTGQSVQTMNMLNNKCRTSFVKPEFLKKAHRANPRLYDIGKLATFSNSFVRKDFSKSKSVTQNNMSNDFSKPVTAQTLPPNKKSILKNTNVLAPGMYKLYTDHNQTRTSQLPQDSRKTNKRVSFSTGVIPTTSVSKPQLKSNPYGDRVMRNNSQGKKQEVEDQHRNVKLPKNKTSVTACNDSLNAKTLNVKSVSAMCDKCVLIDKHEMCVLNSVAKLIKKTSTPSGYKWKPQSGNKNVNPNVEIILFIVDSRCSKHMTGNIKLLINFMEKFPGTIKFGNDQIAPILGYGDLVQRAITIKRVYYVKGLNHNLFSVGQFCDSDLEVAFRKSTCFIRDLKGNDLLTGSRGTDLYSITLQDTNYPNPICLMAKATSSQAWLWHCRLSHLNFNTINLLSKNDIVVGLPKLKFIKDHLCSSCELGKAKQNSFHTKLTPSSKRRLQLLHMDLCGPMRVASINGKRYVLTMALEHDSLIPAIQHQENVFQADRTVTTSNELDLLFSLMFDELLNGSSKVVSKSSAVSAIDAAEAIATACFTQNRSLVIPRHEKTPYHIINERKPSVKFFHIFGFVCYIVRDGENLDKMKEKGDECIFVGYSTQSRAYKVFNKRTRVIMESIHVNFDELPQMASVQNSSDLGPSRHSMALAHNSFDPAPTCQTMESVQISSDPTPE
nr:retrovirus-related Pol polyprotein from transposon TNT 1-94 [Tanacetum cinerariifolium]